MQAWGLSATTPWFSDTLTFSLIVCDDQLTHVTHSPYAHGHTSHNIQANEEQNDLISNFENVTFVHRPSLEAKSRWVLKTLSGPGTMGGWIPNPISNAAAPLACRNSAGKKLSTLMGV